MEGTVQGHGEREEVMREFTSAFLDFHVEVTDLLGSKDKVVTEAIYTMSHESEFTGALPTNVGAEIRPMAKFLVEDATIKQHREYHDRQKLREQLGVTLNGR